MEDKYIEGIFGGNDHTLCKTKDCKRRSSCARNMDRYTILNTYSVLAEEFECGNIEVAHETIQ